MLTLVSVVTLSRSIPESGVCETLVTDDLWSFHYVAFVLIHPSETIIPTANESVQHTKKLVTPMVGAEINKLISNHFFSRFIAGVHWRSDNIVSFLVGEAIALSLFAEQTLRLNDPHSFKVTTLDGVRRCVSEGRVKPPYSICFDDADRRPIPGG